MTNLKCNIPKFHGTSDPEAYLSWALKVDKIFRVQNFSEQKKVAWHHLSLRTMPSCGGNKFKTIAKTIKKTLLTLGRI